MFAYVALWSDECWPTQVEPPMPTGDEEDDEWQAWQRKAIMELPSLAKPITVFADTKCSEAVRIMKDAGIDQVSTHLQILLIMPYVYTYKLCHLSS
jgi:hypothetical protein